MKLKLLLLSFILCIVTVGVGHAQSFFKPLPKPAAFSAGKFSLASDSVMGTFRPVVAISASLSNGASLSSGLGVGYERLKYDATSQAWVTQYSIAALGFISTNGNAIGGTAGLAIGIPGTNGLLSVGPGYDFTGGKWVFMTGAQIQFK